MGIIDFILYKKNKLQKSNSHGLQRLPL